MSFLLTPMPPTFAAAVRDVRAKGRDARIAACQRLALADESELEEAIGALSIASADAEAVVRAAGLRALGELSLEHPDAVSRRAELPVLFSERVRDKSPLVREVATIALGQLGGERAHDELAAALHSEHPEVRFQAIAGYVEAASGADARKLAALLRDDDPEVRSQAARALAGLATAQPEDRPAAIDALKAALSDASLRPRAEAAIALARLGDPSGGDALPGALEDPTLRGDALEAIAALSLTRHADLLFRIARNVFTSPFDRIAMARALVRLGDPRGVELLRSALAGFRAAPRVLAVQAVADLGLAELAPAVAKLEGRPRGVDPTTLSEALAALAPHSPEARAAFERLNKRFARSSP